MTEYEVFISDITPCGGEKYARKELRSVETDDPEAWVRANSRYPIVDIAASGGDIVFTTGDGKGYITRFTFSE